jgi:Bacterial Ig domain
MLSHVLPSRARWPFAVAAALLALIVAGAAAAAPRDTTAPTGAFTSPANGATVSGTITVTGTASDNRGVAKAEIAIDGGTYLLASGTTSWSLSINTTTLSNGSHNLKLRVTDTSGNQAWYDRTINVNNTVVSTAPNVGFTSPASGATVKGTITVTGTASSGAGVARVEVEVVGGSYQLASGTTSWSLSLNTAAYADGAQTLKARVTDNKGVQAWADLPIVISNTVAPPATSVGVNFTSPASGSTVKGTITLTGTAGSPAGVSKVEVRVDGGNYQLASGTTSWSISINTANYADGQHDFKARVTDNVGAQAWADDYLNVANGTSTTSHQIYWGAFINGAQYGYSAPPWDWRGVDTFDSHAGKNISMLALGSNWGSSNNTFPTSAMDTIRSHGMIPFYSWASESDGAGTSDSNFQLQDIINGNYDSYITSFAQAAKAWGHPFFLRLDWEMNLIGTFPWVQTVNGNSAGQYVTMWRHVHDIFTKVGANNATWVWCPNAEYNGSWSPLSSLYPGDSYVDWTCIDGYNWGTNPWYVGHTWQTFTSVFQQTYNDILSFAPTKPIMVGETGSTEYGGSKGNWINGMLAQELPVNFPKIKGFMWFNWYAPPDWEIESSSTAQASFASSIKSSYYSTNTFGSLSTTKVQPLP